MLVMTVESVVSLALDELDELAGLLEVVLGLDELDDEDALGQVPKAGWQPLDARQWASSPPHH